MRRRCPSLPTRATAESPAGLRPRDESAARAALESGRTVHHCESHGVGRRGSGGGHVGTYFLNSCGTKRLSLESEKTRSSDGLTRPSSARLGTLKHAVTPPAPSVTREHAGSASGAAAAARSDGRTHDACLQPRDVPSSRKNRWHVTALALYSPRPRARQFAWRVWLACGSALC